MAVGPGRHHLRAGWRPRPSRRPTVIRDAAGAVVASRLSNKQPGGRPAPKAWTGGWRPGWRRCRGPRPSGSRWSYAVADRRLPPLPARGFSVRRASCACMGAIGSDRLGVLDYGEIGRCRVGTGAAAAGRRKQRDARPVLLGNPRAQCGSEPLPARHATASAPGGRRGPPGGPVRGRPARPAGRPRPRPGRRPRQAPPGRGRRGRGGRRRRRWPPRPPGRR
jgi:hypothetical protein